MTLPSLEPRAAVASPVASPVAAAVDAPAHPPRAARPAADVPVGRARAALVRRGLWLNAASLAYNVAEAGLALGMGIAAGSPVLVGFGSDSVIEVTATLAARWRLGADHDPARRVRVEWWAHRVIGACFLLLAAWVTWESASALLTREAPDASPWGMALLVVSALLMPWVARAKRRLALALGSGALVADAAQTAICAWLSVIALGGVAANALLGWWWADPVAALAMVPIIAREGIGALRGESCCAHHAAPGAACAHGHEHGHG